MSTTTKPEGSKKGKKSKPKNPLRADQIDTGILLTGLAQRVQVQRGRPQEVLKLVLPPIWRPWKLRLLSVPERPEAQPQPGVQTSVKRIVAEMEEDQATITQIMEKNRKLLVVTKSKLDTEAALDISEKKRKLMC
ncbi:hypothetical protein Hanom_Chr04g00356861 [Helianthus anomalus]